MMDLGRVLLAIVSLAKVVVFHTRGIQSLRTLRNDMAQKAKADACRYVRNILTFTVLAVLGW